MTGISRRNLLKGAAFSAAGVAALGLAGCAPQTEATKAEAGLAETGEAAKHTWEVKPEPIAADQIAQTVDTEVLVIGGGYSGSCCALSAAQNGAKTILVEKDAVLNGHGVGGTGSIASRALDDLGLKFDKSLEMERWVSTCGNRCRESLVGKWFRESERCMNWFLDMAEANGANCMVTVGSNSTVHPEIACYHFMSGGPIFEEHTMADFVEYMFEAEALKAGAEFVYEMPAVQLVQDESGKVTGAICQNKGAMGLGRSGQPDLPHRCRRRGDRLRLRRGRQPDGRDRPAGPHDGLRVRCPRKRACPHGAGRRPLGVPVGRARPPDPHNHAARLCARIGIRRGG